MSKERRAARNAPVSETERGALRAGIGRLAWLKKTRPDLCFNILELQTRVNSATVADIMAYNNLVTKAHRDSDIELGFRGLGATSPEELVVLQLRTCSRGCGQLLQSGLLDRGDALVSKTTLMSKF